MPKTTENMRKARKKAFLAAVALTGIVRHAADAVGVNRGTVRDWRMADPEFEAAYQAALEDAADRLEAEAFRRAHDGVKKYVVSHGKLVMVDGADGEKIPLVEQVYSDVLMQTLLRAHRPERFRERSDVKMSGAISVTFTEPGDKDL
jgi:hypothetical protein